MSKEKSFEVALASFSRFYRWRMMRNIHNGLGLTMLEKVAKRAEHYYEWSNHLTSKWSSHD